MLLLVRGTRMARPFSLPLSSGKIRAMAVALPVLVGAKLTRPDLHKGGGGRVGEKVPFLSLP
jgi:thiamine pyrophosphate-dependent acetolactate synthase large subunit-like protein